MTAVHIRTDGMYCDACPHRIECRLEQLPGVKAARAYRAMHLTSVLYDSDLIDADTIRDQIADAGFEAHVVAGGPDPLVVQQRLNAETIARVGETRRYS